jgi:hypothetical protein
MRAGVAAVEALRRIGNGNERECAAIELGPMPRWVRFAGSAPWSSASELNDELTASCILCVAVENGEFQSN